MPTDLPYMASAQNLGAILDRIHSAATPPKFTHDFLKSNLGFGSSNDRAVIKVLKQLHFLTDDGTPTERYNDFRGPNGKAALASGLRDGWAPLFLSDEQIQTKSGQALLGVVKNTTGVGDAVAKKIATTFKTLADRADWTATASATPTETNGNAETPTPTTEPEVRPAVSRLVEQQQGALRLHQDIHLHLPPTSDVSVYRAIFQAMKAELL